MMRGKYNDKRNIQWRGCRMESSSDVAIRINFFKLKYKNSINKKWGHLKPVIDSKLQHNKTQWKENIFKKKC